MDNACVLIFLFSISQRPTDLLRPHNGWMPPCNTCHLSCPPVESESLTSSTESIADSKDATLLALPFFFSLRRLPETKFSKSLTFNSIISHAPAELEIISVGPLFFSDPDCYGALFRLDGKPMAFQVLLNDSISQFSNSALLLSSRPSQQKSETQEWAVKLPSKNGSRIHLKCNSFQIVSISEKNISVLCCPPFFCFLPSVKWASWRKSWVIFTITIHR